MAKITLGFAIVLIGCATSKPNVTEEKFVLRAEAAAEGIALSFENIPPETTRMFINITDWIGKEEISGTIDINSRFADIRGASLDRVKADGKLICPFVNSGVNYHIAVSCEQGKEAVPEDWAITECTAGRGVYFDSAPELALNENQTAVALSAEPVFLGEVEYAPGKYRYGITIKKDEYWSVGVGDNTRGEALFWEFEPQLTDEITASGYLESGDYPAYATAYCNTVYDNITWAVEIAKSREFTVHF